MNLIVIGDSHTVALGQGYQHLRVSGVENVPSVRIAKLFPSPKSLEPFHVEKPDRVILTETTASVALVEIIGRDHLSADDSDKIFALSLGFTTQMLLSRDDWKRFAPWNCPAPGKSLLSDGVVRAMILHHFRHIEAFVRSVRKLGLCCLAVCAPPLLQDDRMIVEGMSPEAALAVDCLARDTMIERFAALGVSSVLPPSETYLGEGRTGFRKPEFRGPGFSGGHGDPAYGRLMFPRVLAAAEQLLQVP